MQRLKTGGNVARENSLYLFNEVKSKFIQFCFKTIKPNDEDEQNILTDLL